MAVVSSFGQVSRTSSQTGRFRETFNEFTTRSSFSLNCVGTSYRALVLRGWLTRTAANKRQKRVTCRAAGHVDKYGQCKCIEDAVTFIMKDAIQHCLTKENDVMRSKVLEQMGRGLAALCRVSVGVAAESSAAPIPFVPEFSTIREEDLEQVRKLIHLTSLPFSSTEDEEFKRLSKMLKTSGRNRSLSTSELSQICERLSSDMVQCVGPIIMCFPELPLWAKHRAMMLPAEVARKTALSLLTGPR